MMKKIVFVFLMLMAFLVVAGCGEETPVDPDLDLPAELKEDSGSAVAGQATTVGKVTYEYCTDSDGGSDPNVPGYIHYSYTYLGKTREYSSPDSKLSNGKFLERVCNGDLPAYDKNIYKNPPCTEFVSATVNTPVGPKTAYACKVEGAAPAASTLFADINGDGKVSTTDLQCYALVAQDSSASCAKVSVAAADLDCDNLVTAADQKLAASVIMGQGPAAVDANGNGVLDCKEPKTCTPGPTGVVTCEKKGYSSFYAGIESQDTSCNKKVDLTYCGQTNDACATGKGCCEIKSLSSWCVGDQIYNSTESSCNPGVTNENVFSSDCSKMGNDYVSKKAYQCATKNGQATCTVLCTPGEELVTCSNYGGSKYVCDTDGLGYVYKTSAASCPAGTTCDSAKGQCVAQTSGGSGGY